MQLGITKFDVTPIVIGYRVTGALDYIYYTCKVSVKQMRILNLAELYQHLALLTEKQID